VAFLRQHHAELLRLKAWPGVEDFTLDFGWVCPYGLSVRRYNRFPADLLAECAALQLGIEVALYFVDPAEVPSSEFEPA
jgi:hypothetical protein